MKMERLRWAGRVVRMDPSDPVKRLFLYNSEGKRELGEPRLRWQDGVKWDVEAAGIRNWKTAAMDRGCWQRLHQQARTQPRL